jgi:hypothetical protein
LGLSIQLAGLSILQAIQLAILELGKAYAEVYLV